MRLRQRPSTAMELAEIEAYFARRLREFNVSIEQVGTLVQLQTWRRRRETAFGALTLQFGNPNAVAHIWRGQS